MCPNTRHEKKKSQVTQDNGKVKVGWRFGVDECANKQDFHPGDPCQTKSQNHSYCHIFLNLSSVVA